VHDICKMRLFLQFTVSQEPWYFKKVELIYYFKEIFFSVC